MGNGVTDPPNFFQKSFDDLFLKAPARIRSACKLESSPDLGLELHCKSINSTGDFLLEDDAMPDQNPNAIVVDDRAAQGSILQKPLRPKRFRLILFR
jgi:hypothetical protein